MGTDDDLDLQLEDDFDGGTEGDEFNAARDDLERRASAAEIPVKAASRIDGSPVLQVEMRCGRRTRTVWLSSTESIRRLLATPFEQFRFLCGYEAVVSYAAGTIEAAIRPIGGRFAPPSWVYRRLFSDVVSPQEFDLESACLRLESPRRGSPGVEISAPTEEFGILTRTPLQRGQLTLKLSGCQIRTHDEALDLLRKTADAVFFQIDMLKGVPVYLERERKRRSRRRTRSGTGDMNSELQYPRYEYDEAPISLYWYARSAEGMPLLQFLAFYQVVEFYFPVYAEAETQRKLKALLKDPTFRGDRDADIGRLLSAIHVNRAGSFGTEIQQLKATLKECVDPDELRSFLQSDVERSAFYTGKSKVASNKTIPLAKPQQDLRDDTATRLYEIRCGIVHTKNDSSENVARLLPYSSEAEQLTHDIELMEFVARSVLVAGSSPFHANG